MRFGGVQSPERWWLKYTELAILFFLHAMAMAMWFVPLGTVLTANGLKGLVAAGFATSGVSAIISPLIFGAMADQRYAPVKVLRGLAVCTSIAMALAATSIGQRWGWVPTLILMHVHALFSAPTFGLSTTIILSRLSDAKREFGPIRAVATLGWMAGCWLVSGFHFDGSCGAGYGGSIIWLVVAAYTFLLPAVDPPRSTTRLSWKQRLGLDALTLFKNPDTRTVFLGAAIYNIPLCAFYPYSPVHMKDLGLNATTAWMTLGQVTEIIAMLSLGALFTRWRLKTIFLLGMTFGIARFAFCGLGGKFWLLAGVSLHGFAFAFYLITAQIYLEQRIPSTWRARAQALLSLMNSGWGALIGYFACGAWHDAATTDGHTNWPLFWGVLAGSIAVIWIWFARSYHGRPGVDPSTFVPPTLPPGTPLEPGNAGG